MSFLYFLELKKGTNSGYENIFYCKQQLYKWNKRYYNWIWNKMFDRNGFLLFILFLTAWIHAYKWCIPLNIFFLEKAKLAFYLLKIVFNACFLLLSCLTRYFFKYFTKSYFVDSFLLFIYKWYLYKMYKVTKLFIAFNCQKIKQPWHLWLNIPITYTKTLF